LVSNLRGSMSTPGRRVPYRLLCRDREPSIGDGSLDPVRAKLSDVTSVIRVTIVVIQGRPEREIGGKTGDRHREHEEEANSKNRSDSPKHTRMIARGRTFGCAIPVLSRSPSEGRPACDHVVSRDRGLWRSGHPRRVEATVTRVDRHPGRSLGWPREEAADLVTGRGIAWAVVACGLGRPEDLRRRTD